MPKVKLPIGAKPWNGLLRVEKMADGELWIFDEHDKFICSTDVSEVAHAIFQALNSHARLVECLKSVLDEYEDLLVGVLSDEQTEALLKARALIKEVSECPK